MCIFVIFIVALCVCVCVLLAIKIQLHDKYCVNISTINSFTWTSYRIASEQPKIFIPLVRSFVRLFSLSPVSVV